MHVLTVISHPNQDSFTHAIAHRFCEGVKDNGNTFEIADLHAENFDPRWTMHDLSDAPSNATSVEIRREQERIERADAICMAFPLFWFSMPAMMKGWMDRVWTYGWTYDQVNDPNQSLQRSRIGVMLVPAGGNPEHWQPFQFEESMEVLWKAGMLGYFGMTDKRVHILNSSEGSHERRMRLLDRAYDVGISL